MSKKKYKIIYPEYKECDEGMDIRIRPVKLYDEEGFAPEYRLNEGKHSWDEISSFITALELDLLHLRAEFKEKAKEFSRENRQKERLLVNNNKLKRGVKNYG
jgi:septation ring formation regulator EzrA